MFDTFYITIFYAEKVPNDFMKNILAVRCLLISRTCISGDELGKVRELYEGQEWGVPANIFFLHVWSFLSMGCRCSIILFTGARSDIR